MRVFTDEWVAELKRRYSKVPIYQRPATYFLATEDHNQALRLEIEEWVSGQPETVHHNLIQRLRSPDNVTHAYHELVVADLIHKQGFELEHDKEIDGLTPDWYVNGQTEDSPFIIEVCSVELPEVRASEELHVRQLILRLQQIPCPITLLIRANHTHIELDDRRCKELSARVRRWLLNDRLGEGDTLEIEDFTFTVVQLSGVDGCVATIGPARGFNVDAKRLRRSLEHKVDKYGMLARNNGLPLVIAVVTNFGTGLTIGDLKTELFGRTVQSFDTDTQTGEILGSHVRALNDGLFTKEPILSCALWVERIIKTGWTLEAIHNATALNPQKPLLS